MNEADEMNFSTSVPTGIEAPLRRQNSASSGNSEITITTQDEEQPGVQQPKAIDVPPNGGYGWVCVGCAFTINAHTWGLNSVRFRV